MSFRDLAYQDAAGNPWFSWEYVRDNSTLSSTLLREHVTLTAEAVADRRGRSPSRWPCWRTGSGRSTGPILALSGVLYTIPSLALLAFIAPCRRPDQADVGADRRWSSTRCC